MSPRHTFFGAFQLRLNPLMTVPR